MRNSFFTRIILALATTLAALPVPQAQLNPASAPVDDSAVKTADPATSEITAAEEAELIEQLKLEAQQVNPIEDGVLLAQNDDGPRSGKRKRKTRTSTESSSAPRAGGSSKIQNDPHFTKARALADAGKYQEASQLLFRMSRSSRYERDSAQIKYILGLMLFEMKLNQAAAFVFFDVIRQESRNNPKSNYLRKSLEKLALAADSLNSEVLLRYAVKQVNEEEFPAANRDMLYYRTGEIKLAEKQYSDAATQFARVRQGSLFYSKARYKLAMALAEAGELEKAFAGFDDMAQARYEGSVTNNNRVNALMGKARVMYQMKNFDGALEVYREIPRDTEQWHDSLFESSWAMVRDGRFRSALSVFHSLHSSFYEDFYQPESLLVRAIVYLYICRYDEMEKVLNLFQGVYRPVQRDLSNVLRSVNEPLTYYRELARVQDNFEEMRKARNSRKGTQVPFVVARQVLKEGDVKRTFSYLQKLDEEKKRMEGLAGSWRTSAVGQYSRKILEQRIQATRLLAGKQIRRHLIIIHNDLRKFMEQDGLLRFERISSKRDSLSKEIAGKGIPRSTHIDEQTERDYYIQNGYEYWPFLGEYWLDEIGNYHYVGVRACD